MQPPKASVVNDPYKSAPGKLANGRSVKYEEVYLRAYDSVSERSAVT
jgi:hypothetical protein